MQLQAIKKELIRVKRLTNTEEVVCGWYSPLHANYFDLSTHSLGVGGEGGQVY